MADTRRHARQDPYGPASVEIVKSAGVNSFYGHSSIIRRYCGYPQDRPLPYIVQHGSVGLSQDFYEVKQWYHHEALTRYWSWNHVAAEQAFACGSKFNVDILGSPFLYLIRMIEESLKALDKGVGLPRQFKLDDVERDIEEVNSALRDQDTDKLPLVFAPHSLPKTRDLPKEAHLDIATKLITEEGIESAVICLHPYDVYLGNHTPYADTGFKVTSCMSGVITNHPWSSGDFWREYQKVGIEYLINLYKLLIRSSTCYFYGISTPLFYAGYLRIRCKLLTYEASRAVMDVESVRVISSKSKRQASQADLSVCPNLNEVLRSNSIDEEDAKMFSHYCDTVLGASRMVSPNQLLALLTNAYIEHQEHTSKSLLSEYCGR